MVTYFDKLRRELHAVALADDRVQAAWLFDRRIDIDLCDPEGRTVLMKATVSVLENVMNTLLLRSTNEPYNEDEDQKPMMPAA